MGAEDEVAGWSGWPQAPGGAPPVYVQKDDHWTHFDNSVNAVSFGFVATAILISLFIGMAIFEKFIRTTSPPAGDNRHRRSSDMEEQNHVGGFSPELWYPSPKMTVNTREFSVLMPGHSIPTFIAHPAPMPCPPERMPWPSHQRSGLKPSPDLYMSPSSA